MIRFCRAVAVIASLLLGLSVVGPLAPTGKAQDIAQESRTRLQGLAAALDQQDTVVRTLLVQLGFPPQSAPETWRHWQNWPSVRMLEAGYYSAEAARPGSGQDFLVKFTRLVAANHVDAIRYEPALAGIFTEPAGTPVKEPLEKVAFGVPAPEKLKAELPPEAKRLIKIVTHYTESVHRPWLFAVCCNLTEDETYDILRREPDDPTAFEAAIKLKSPPPTNEQKLGRLVEAVHADNPAIAFEPAMTDRLGTAAPKISEADLRTADDQVSKGVHDLMLPLVSAAMPPPGPGVGTIPPAPEPGPAPTLQRRAMAEESYRVFQSSRYPTAGRSGWTFSRMTGRVFGFGGVIFGNQVTAEPGLPPPVHILWQPTGAAAAPTSPDVTEDWGRLIFLLKDGRTVVSHVVRADTVTAARALAFDHGVQPGSGYGLVGYIGGFTAASVDGDDEVQSDGDGYSFVVHPDVVATRLGHSLMLLDTLPMIADDFVEQVSDAGAPKSTVEQLRRILNGSYGELGQYKFQDVKLQIRPEAGGVIGVQRSQADAPDASAAQRNAAYMTLISFNGDTPRPEKAVPMYQLIPTLVRVADPFARANEFAEVFALLRWSKAMGATWAGQPSAAPDVQPATALVVGEDRDYRYGASAAAFQQTFANEVADHADAIASRSNNAALISTSTALRGHFARFIEAEAAIGTAGTVSETLGAAFSADPALANRYRSIAAKVIAASTFREGGASIFKRMEAEDWIGAHIEELDRIVPGLKFRQSLGDKLKAEHAAIIKILGDPIALLNSITNDAHATVLNKLRDELAQDSSDEQHASELGQKLQDEVDQTLAGFATWVELESSLLKVLGS